MTSQDPSHLQDPTAEPLEPTLVDAAMPPTDGPVRTFEADSDDVGAAQPDHHRIRYNPS